MSFKMDVPIISNRGHEKFYYKGFIYNFDKCSKSDDALKFWRCEQMGRCKGRIHTKSGEVIKVVNGHSHLSSEVNAETANVSKKFSS